jgi:hypothetical protein
MGDMLTLYEKAQSAIKEEDSKRFQDRLMANKYDFNDFLGQFKQINNMGGLQVGAGGGPGAALQPGTCCCCSVSMHASYVQLTDRPAFDIIACIDGDALVPGPAARWVCT